MTDTTLLPFSQTTSFTSQPSSQSCVSASSLPLTCTHALTAAAVARDRRLGRPSSPLTLLNRQKAVRYRGDGADEGFDAMVKRMADLRLHRLGSADGMKIQPDPADEGKGARRPRAASRTSYRDAADAL